MSSDLERFQRIKTAAEQLQREADRSEGALQQAMSELRKQFKCRSLEDAELLLEQTEKAQQQLTKQLARELESFQHKWEEMLQ